MLSAILRILFVLQPTQPPPPPTPINPGIHWPEVTHTEPTPTPPPAPPNPALPIDFAPDQMFVVYSDSDCDLVESPPGSMKIQRSSGSLTVRAKFVGGTGTFETKTFTSANIFTVEPAGFGSAELIMTVGSLKEPKHSRRSINLTSPTPPPAPPNPPTPPNPPAPPQPTDTRFDGALPSNPTDFAALVKKYGDASTGLRVLIVYDDAAVAALPAGQVQIMSGADTAKFLNSQCSLAGTQPNWRIWSKLVNTSNVSKSWQDAFAKPRTSLPWVSIWNEK